MALRKSGDTQAFLLISALASLFLRNMGSDYFLLRLRSVKGAGLAFQRLEIDSCLDLWIPLG
jgi:hypothetical protein